MMSEQLVVENHPDVQDPLAALGDLTDVPLRPRRRRSKFTIALVVVAVSAAAFAGGAWANRNHSSSASASPSAFARAFAGGAGGFGGGGGAFGAGGGATGAAAATGATGATGADSAGPATSGEIVRVDHNTIVVRDANGKEVRVDAGAARITRSTPLTVSDLGSGQFIVVQGTTNSDGSVTARQVSAAALTTTTTASTGR